MSKDTKQEMLTNLAATLFNMVGTGLLPVRATLVANLILSVSCMDKIGLLVRDISIGIKFSSD